MFMSLSVNVMLHRIALVIVTSESTVTPVTTDCKPTTLLPFCDAIFAAILGLMHV